MTIEKPRPLSFPVPFPEIPSFLLEVNVPRERVHDLLGPPMLTNWVDGLGNADFWAYQYSCGLQIAFQFLHESNRGSVLADSPEIDHVLRHIPFEERDCVRIDANGLRLQLKLLLTAFPERQSEIESLHSFQVWRQGDDGNSFAVGNPTSERDAKCRVQQFESLGHKQLYWYSRVFIE